MHSTASTIVGALACQRNSFLKTLKTFVISSSEYQFPQAGDKKNKKAQKEDKKTKYAIELQDTVLFPEGGGQPYDTGRLLLPDKRAITVESVLRDKLTALHITSEPIDPGTEVTVEVDWQRRTDHMQQHTGQHLLSAVLDTYNLETLSWAMGETINYIELPRKVDDSLLEEVTDKLNSLIFESVSIKVSTPDKSGHDIDISHIPDDYDTSKGIIRVVNIGELDSNPCCGTHLSSTAQIQSIALLHQVSIRGGNSRLHFLCGGRVPKYLAKQHSILRNSGSQLSCQIDEVSDKISNLNLSYKKTVSKEAALMKELAGIEATRVFETFKSGNSEVDYVYRYENSPEFLNFVFKELLTLINASKPSEVDLDSKHTIVLFCGDRSENGGIVKIVGPKASTISSDIKERLSNLKGGGKGSSFQGKVTSYEKGEVTSLRSYLDEISGKV